MQNIYNQIKNHPNHKRKLNVEESFYGKKGRICYSKNEVTIEMDINLGGEALLVLAHELMHYLLVLNGALLPIKKNEEVSNDAEALEGLLMQSITHHMLLKRELDSSGFRDLQHSFALSDELQRMPNCLYYDEKFWLLELYDRSTFAQNYNFGDLREMFQSYGLISIFNLLQDSSKDSINDINRISRLLINEFNCRDYLQLTDLDGYTSREYL